MTPGDGRSDRQITPRRGFSKRGFANLTCLSLSLSLSHSFLLSKSSSEPVSRIDYRKGKEETWDDFGGSCFDDYGRIHPPHPPSPHFSGGGEEGKNAYRREGGREGKEGGIGFSFFFCQSSVETDR